MSPIDPSFGHWFAGFTDGEGCFHINVGGRYKSSYNCGFSMGVRDDDRRVLEQIKETTGLGSLYTVDVRKYEWNQRPGAKPQCRWHVQNKVDCLTLCEILDEFPLRSKKAQDYSIWRQAVEHWAERNWLEMGELRDELMSGRAYKEAELTERSPSLFDEVTL